MLLVQILPSSLNSRKSLDNEGIKVFGLDSVAERNFIARAQRFAVAERYNAPQVTFYVFNVQMKACSAYRVPSCRNANRLGSISRLPQRSRERVKVTIILPKAPSSTKGKSSGYNVA